MTTAAELKEIQKRGKARARAEERARAKQAIEMGKYEADSWLPEILKGLRESAQFGNDPLHWYKFKGYAGGWTNAAMAEIKRRLEKLGFKDVVIKNHSVINKEGGTSVSVECTV